MDFRLFLTGHGTMALHVHFLRYIFNSKIVDQEILQNNAKIYANLTKTLDSREKCRFFTQTVVYLCKNDRHNDSSLFSDEDVSDFSHNELRSIL